MARAARTLYDEPVADASFWTLAREGRESGLDGGPHQTSADTQQALLHLVQHLFLPVGTSRDGLRSVMFAAPGNCHAANLTAASVAEMLVGYTRRRVCLVDANLRNPFLHRRFGLGNNVGLADVLADTRMLGSVAVQVEPTLWVVTAGQRISGQLASPAAYARAVSALHDTFDVVVFAACSRGVDDEALALAHAVDGVALVVDQSVRRDVARHSVSRLQAAQCHVSGVVLCGSPRTSFLARLLRPRS